MIDFVSLHNHTHFSILDALPSPEDLFLRAKELGQKAIAITDHGTFAGTWESLQVSKDTGVKLIIGCEFYFQDDVEVKDEKFRHVILIAKNEIGYRNILTLNYKGYEKQFIFGSKVFSVIDWKLLEKHSEGVICLTACANGIIGQLLTKQKFDDAEAAIIKLKNIFGDDLGLEIQPNNLKRGFSIYNDQTVQNHVNRHTIKLAKKHNVRIVPTTNTHYTKKEDADTHDTLLAIGSHGQPKHSNFRLKYPVQDFYLKSGEEVCEFFQKHFGLEESETLEFCANTIYFADKCEFPNWIDPKYSNPSGKELPVFPVKDESDYNEFLEYVAKNYPTSDLEEDKLYLRFKCEEVFLSRTPQDKIQEYRDRLEEELDVIYDRDISSYMLIVMDFIRYCNNNGISVGPGRGSVGGCLVAYLLNIHKADPIQYGLVFPRFFNKLKKDYSDIDSDFSKANRGKVIDYITQKYGQENVAQISNVISMTPKIYIKDIARVCELDGSKDAAIQLGNDIAACVAADIKSIDDAINKVPLFAEYTNKYPEFLKYKDIAGKQRAVGVHAAGLVIGKRPLHQIVPVRRDKEGSYVVEYDKNLAEENGLVKMDILGLNTLDIIDATNELIKAGGKPAPVINYDEYDKKTYDLISAGDTLCVFQFGTSGGTIDLCRKVEPKSIEDLAVITTLARPASKEIREDFIKTKKGQREVSLLHPLLSKAFEKTLGFPLYDESLLVLAKDVAGWDLAEADKLRKLTKEKGKNPEKVKQWRQEFVDGSKKNNIKEEIANMIWEKIVEPYGRYSFNKSHAVLYSMISYHTAYLKAHYPIEFLLANLISEVKSNAPDAPANKAKIKNEIRNNKVKIISPDINQSELHYTISDNKLLTGLDAIKYVSDDAINDIIQKRPFKSFFDFMARVDSKKVRSNTIQALVASGCMDSFNIPRKLMFLYCSDYRKKLTTWLKKHNNQTEEFFYPWTDEKDWESSEKYALENYYLGEGFSCKPADAYKGFFKPVDYTTISQVKKLNNKDKIKSMKVIIKGFYELKIKKETSKYYGQSMIKADIEDCFGDRCSLTIFPDKWTRVQERIKTLYKNKFTFGEGMALNFCGSANLYDDEMGIILDDVYNVLPPPQVPSDLKAKKISLKDSKQGLKSSLNDSSEETIMEEIEEALIEEGFMDDEED